MDEIEKYLFDLHGCLVVPGALTGEQLTVLNRLVDEQIAAQPDPAKNTFRFGNVLSWGQPTRELIASQRILPYLKALVGKRPRLDHDYADIIRHGLGPIGAHLHGGGTPHDPSQYYRVVDGQMVNGLIVVVYALKDVQPGDGGFACVPGSHKANFALPPGWADITGILAPGVTPVPCRAGDAIIFTEALTHGTLPWQGKDERRSLFFKHSPHYLSWSAGRYHPDDYPDLPPEGRTGALD